MQIGMHRGAVSRIGNKPRSKDLHRHERCIAIADASDNRVVVISLLIFWNGVNLYVSCRVRTIGALHVAAAYSCTPTCFVCALGYIVLASAATKIHF